MRSLGRFLTISSLILVVLVLAGCPAGSNHESPATNQAAALVGDLSENPLEWNAITTQIDRHRSYMSTLYGNDPALAHAMSTEDAKIPADARFALVTWRQQADPNWFGAKIPGKVKSVEMVYWNQQPGAEDELTYLQLEGSPLQPSPHVSPSQADQRKRYITSLKAAVMP
ncbi:cytochrome P460 family protein [Blastopirellula sp. J2-11]|uniref:cytochrome P460 family protein n=1 Tax=Blastopirellula sp. J2-11 TaxID=2943192 RepID=UPI0021C8DE3A|nr:cytochrome P460 family protein [Blastopirellula sp. J2-11]UUO04345.1 cytochrome P460 family protein [Blastopirellula sp. J2-11]